ncbi:MAG: hypothetical protein ABMA01_02760 [Chthoniobacteraceae bacterium]
MGLTIHFTMTAPIGIDSMAAKRLVLAAREIALTAQRRGDFDEVSDLRQDEHARLRLLEWLIVPVPGFANASTGIEIAPLEGHAFRIRVGEGSEPLWIGLCRYPTHVDVDGVETNVRRGGRWRLTGFCKTQYASVHGWEHFRRCHTGVISLLAELRTLGLRVRISDEGGYWPRRSERVLREKIDAMNRLTAAFAGAAKDAAEEGGQARGMQAAIFAHPHFERLEAEGTAERPDIADAARRVMERE